MTLVSNTMFKLCFYSITLISPSIIIETTPLIFKENPPLEQKRRICYIMTKDYLLLQH